jgi:hypothetical protein
MILIIDSTKVLGGLADRLCKAKLNQQIRDILKH